MVEIEESAQAVAPPHVGGPALRRWRLLQKPVVESLMVALAVVVLKVLPREEAQVALTKRDHTSETFLLDRPNKPFGVCALRLGLFGGSRMGCTAPLVKMSVTTRVYRGSRS